MSNKNKAIPLKPHGGINKPGTYIIVIEGTDEVLDSCRSSNTADRILHHLQSIYFDVKLEKRRVK